jgi:hypothetical protein
MATLGADLVIAALRAPASCSALSLSQWDLLIRQARSADLLARLALLLDAAGVSASLPAAPAAHLRAAAALAHAQHAEVRRELAHIRAALAPLGLCTVLLKGAAYVQAGLPAALGRLFSDVDVLVPKPRLAEVEEALMIAGWATTHHSAYDQRYYRQWMHELPPLVHLRRQTAIDVHHAIAPETARVPVDSALLLARVRVLADAPDLGILAPVDMVLHSMLHLLQNEELSHGLRDLSDLDLLLREFGAEGSFWDDLCSRAEQLGLGRTLFYGLRQARHILATPVPGAVVDRCQRFAPKTVLRSLMDALWQRTLRSPHPSCGDRWSASARFALYLRAHWQRMPPLLLARHLTVKALGLHETSQRG